MVLFHDAVRRWDKKGAGFLEFDDEPFHFDGMDVRSFTLKFLKVPFFTPKYGFLPKSLNYPYMRLKLS